MKNWFDMEWKSGLATHEEEAVQEISDSTEKTCVMECWGKIRWTKYKEISQKMKNIMKRV